jgi:hypothetical protein
MNRPTIHYTNDQFTRDDKPISLDVARTHFDAVDANWSETAYQKMSAIIIAEPIAEPDTVTLAASLLKLNDWALEHSVTADSCHDLLVTICESLKACRPATPTPHAEIIFWHDATISKPDEEITVLVSCADGSVGDAYVEDSTWYWCGSASEITEPVYWWADLPQSPNPP